MPEDPTSAFLKDLPLIAILRGIQPSEIIETAAVIYEAGFKAIEVPLNSPDPLESIGLLVDHFGDRMAVGAGTVLSPNDVRQVSERGGKLIVSPNVNPEVIALTKELGMHSLPGVMTSSECFSALGAGADGLKLFPASMAGYSGLKALRAVLPKQTKVYAVGGADASNLGEWVQAGADGMGLGSCLYKAGDSVASVAENARQLVASFRQASA